MELTPETLFLETHAPISGAAPAKWTAKLRELKTDDNLLLFKTDMSAGHGGASGRFESLKEDALEYAFILKLENKIDGK